MEGKFFFPGMESAVRQGHQRNTSIPTLHKPQLTHHFPETYLHYFHLGLTQLNFP